MSTQTQEQELINYSNNLFELVDYVQESSVRHARRGWVNAVQYLRERSGGSLWVKDRAAEIEKQCDSR